MVNDEIINERRDLLYILTSVSIYCIGWWTGLKGSNNIQLKRVNLALTTPSRYLIFSQNMISLISKTSLSLIV